MPSAVQTDRLSAPRLVRRVLCAAYEFCLLFAITFVAGYLFTALLQWRAPLPGPRQSIFNAYLFCVVGAYFVYFWTHGGQTLAMKTWRIRVVATDGASLGVGRACLRYFMLWWGLLPGALAYALTTNAVLAAVVFAGCSVLSILWLFFDRDRQALHDRISGTRLVSA